MEQVEILNKEVDECVKNISSQHQQVKYYFQSYMIAIVGLFSLAGFFSKDLISISEMFIGIMYSVCVFFLGWIFLSIISHKVAMLILVYKHMAIIRRTRLRKLNCNETTKSYVLPTDPTHIRMPGLLKFLPYLLFIFNFAMLCGTISYYLSYHLMFHQVTSVVCFIAVLFGSFYPIACVSYRKHTDCAKRANSLESFHRIEILWNKASKKVKKISSFHKKIFIFIGFILSITGVYVSSLNLTETYQYISAVVSIIGVSTYGYLRYLAEKYKIDFTVKKLKIA